MLCCAVLWLCCAVNRAHYLALDLFYDLSSVVSRVGVQGMGPIRGTTMAELMMMGVVGGMTQGQGQGQGQGLASPFAPPGGAAAGGGGGGGGGGDFASNVIPLPLLNGRTGLHVDVVNQLGEMQAYIGQVRQTDRQTDRKTHSHVGRHTYRHTCRQADGRVDNHASPFKVKTECVLIVGSLCLSLCVSVCVVMCSSAWSCRWWTSVPVPPLLRACLPLSSRSRAMLRQEGSGLLASLMEAAQEQARAVAAATHWSSWYLKSRRVLLSARVAKACVIFDKKRLVLILISSGVV